MAIRRYLAMTAGEFRENRELSGEIGYLACHFSSYDPGISNLPQWLPPDALLILDDMTPIQGHDPNQILEQLGRCIQELRCAGLLLDFQREGYEEACQLVSELTQSLPCPVAVSAAYGQGLDCPVCLPPVPPSTALRDHLQPWQGRELWLELALEGEQICLREQGAQIQPLDVIPNAGFADGELNCHYRIAVTEDAATFSLWRTREDLEALLKKAESLGVTTAVGLYQEFGS